MVSLSEIQREREVLVQGCEDVQFDLFKEALCCLDSEEVQEIIGAEISKQEQKLIRARTKDALGLEFLRTNRLINEHENDSFEEFMTCHSDRYSKIDHNTYSLLKRYFNFVKAQSKSSSSFCLEIDNMVLRDLFSQFRERGIASSVTINDIPDAMDQVKSFLKERSPSIVSALCDDPCTKVQDWVKNNLFSIMSTVNESEIDRIADIENIYIEEGAVLRQRVGDFFVDWVDSKVSTL